MIPLYYVGQDPGADRDQAEKIAILGLEVVGTINEVTVRVARDLTAALRARAASGPYAIAPNSDKELIDEKLMHNCDDERKECMAKIGRKLNADHLLYGRIEPRSQGGATGYQVSLRLLDVNNGNVTSATDFIPAAESSGEQLADRGRRGFEHLLTSIRPKRDRRPVTDRVLVNATNEAFWQLTGHKRGQQLDMSDPRDRAMSKTWLDLYAQIRGRRDRAVNLAKRILNETVTPYVLVIEQPDGSLTHRTFERRGNLDVQYAWLLDQPEYYTYLAMFDFTQSRNAPIRDQFRIVKRQEMATSGWYGW
jgi:hypothetical protein